MVVDVEISLAVQVLEEALIHEAKSKSKSLRGVEEKFKLLKDYLWATQNFLENANYKRQLEDERVRGWISEVREVANEAEDKVEMFLVKAERRRRRRRRLFKSIITKLSALHKRQLFKSIITKRDEIGDDIDSIWDRLSALHKRHNISNIRPVPFTKGIITEAQLRLPSRDEHVVGMEDEVEKVLRGSLILDEKKKGVSVAVVEGMVGIGKTTLAWEIYNHPDVVARFEWRGWVTVSSEFTLERTMKQLILQLPASHSQKLRELELELEEFTKAKPYVQQKFQEMLRKHLQGKTYFIVLDDVWEKEHWESLKPAFPDEQDKASRLLVTTRNKYIATDDQYTHGMKLLDPEKSWELLLMKTRFDECPEKFEHTGREIVERCEGLPLAISEVGGLLAATRTKWEWEQVLNQISSHLERAGVFKSWELSYRNLSPWLKSCFLCLAFFKGDATIPAKTLMHIWVGQGLIQQDHTATARGYLEELIDRNMLQIVDLNIEGRVKNCYLHGILREVCLRRANEELGLEMKTGEDGISIPWHQSRHRVLNGGNLEILSLCRGKHLRSLFLRNNEGVGVGVDVEYVISLLPHDFGKSCKLLKTLSLDGFTLSRFPDFLGSLIRLKYLRIRRHKMHSKYEEHQLEPMKLPDWLDGLEHLEIVDMEGEKVEFPNDVTLEMKRLRYFRAYCVRGPISIDSWGNIETLKYMRLDDWMSCCRSLNSICGVRELGLFLDLLNTPREWSNVRASLLLRTPMLEYLQLRWNPIIPIDPQIVSHLPTHLTKLKLRGKLTKCPPPTMFPPNLTHLTLAFSGLHQDLMPQLSELPKLSHLKLSGNAYKPEIMQVLHHGFPCLKALSLKEMFRLKSIHIDKRGMPCLQQLRIQQCPSLQTMNLPQHVVIKRVT